MSVQVGTNFTGEAGRLQNERQQLQNAMLIKVASTNSGGLSAENEKRMKDRIEELSHEIRAVRKVRDYYEKESDINS